MGSSTMVSNRDRPRESKLDIKATAEALAAAPDGAALQRTLGPLDLDKLSANDVSLLSRALQKRTGAPDVKVACLGNFTLDLLPRCVDVCFAREGLTVAHYSIQTDRCVGRGVWSTG